MSTGSDTVERKGHKRKLTDTLTPSAASVVDGAPADATESTISQVWDALLQLVCRRFELEAIQMSGRP